MAYGVTLRQVSDALMAILSDRVPEIPWKAAVMGPSFPKGLTGFVCCDEVDYEPFVKGDRIAEAVFGIQIICPNPKGKETDTTLVEDYAMKVRRVLAEEWTLDNWAVDSTVNSITFATPAGLSSIGIAIIKYTVGYEEG